MASTGPSLFPSQAVTTSFSGLYPGSTDYPGTTDYTGDVITPTATLYPSITNYPGQGLNPIVRCRLSFDNVSVSVPSWSEVTNSKLRAFSTSRGRPSEMGEIEAGNATVTLDNRDRAYDPTVNTSIRPLNRVWLYEEFSGEVQDIFRGYAESWEQHWPGGGWSDAEAVIQAADELKILSLDSLPTTNPPRDSYSNLVLFDQPDGYWGMGDDGITEQQQEITNTPPAQIEDNPDVATSTTAEAVVTANDDNPERWRKYRGWPR